jgi:hypothetical protein
MMPMNVASRMMPMNENSIDRRSSPRDFGSPFISPSSTVRYAQ